MNMILSLLAPIIMKIVEDLLKPKNIKKYGRALFSLLREFITDSDTKWDDKWLLPVLDLFEAGLFDAPDDD